MKCTYTLSYSHESCGFVSLLVIPSHRSFHISKRNRERGKKSDVIVAWAQLLRKCWLKQRVSIVFFRISVVVHIVPFSNLLICMFLWFYFGVDNMITRQQDWEIVHFFSFGLAKGGSCINRVVLSWDIFSFPNDNCLGIWHLDTLSEVSKFSL